MSPADGDPPGDDELAGVVDLFGGLARGELIEALTELAFKRGEEPDPAALAERIDAAVDDYALVAVDAGDAPADGELLLAGPAAFPTLPDGAEDLPHIMDVDRREVDRAAAGEQVLARLRGEAARAVDAGDDEAVRRLLDASYDLEAWAPVDAAGVRERLDDALAE